METEELHGIFLRSNGVTTDTRKILPGQLFFALKGENFDGNTYSAAAIEKGAIAVVIDNPLYAIEGKTILVSDTLTALQELASYHRKQYDIPVLAITGSNGKTTSKELVHRVLSKKYSVLSTISNLNNHIGVPLTLLRIHADTDIAVIEMGANHQKEIAALCHIAYPTHGLICSIGKAHVEGFGGIEGVKKGKGEMYDHLLEHNGTIFVNRSTPYLAEMLGDRPGNIIFYGLPGSVVYGEVLEEQPFVKGVIYVKEQPMAVSSHLIGAYNFTNIVNAFAVGHHFGVSANDMAEAIASYFPDNNRSQVVQRDNYQVIMDAYNANPTSVSNAISYFDRRPEKNKVVILGDMFELGDAAPQEHQAIVDQLAGTSFSLVVLVGPLFSETKRPDNFISFSSTNEAAYWWENVEKDGQVVLLKGSRGMQMEKIMGAGH